MKSMFKKKATDALGKIVSMMTESELMEWPPPCCGYFYQPEQPVFSASCFEKSLKNDRKKVKSD
ncbi:MAG: hypothetical protein RR635_08350 [Oscillospiraceae bacterium]